MYNRILTLVCVFYINQMVMHSLVKKMGAIQNPKRVVTKKKMIVMRLRVIPTPKKMARMKRMKMRAILTPKTTVTMMRVIRIQKMRKILIRKRILIYMSPTI